jgi:hypothetical protein
MFTNGFNKGLIFVSHNSHHTSRRCAHISTDCGHQHLQMSIICEYIYIFKLHFVQLQKSYTFFGLMISIKSNGRKFL